MSVSLDSGRPWRLKRTSVPTVWQAAAGALGEVEDALENEGSVGSLLDAVLDSVWAEWHPDTG